MSQSTSLATPTTVFAASSVSATTITTTQTCALLVTLPAEIRVKIYQQVFRNLRVMWELSKQEHPIVEKVVVGRIIEDLFESPGYTMPVMPEDTRDHPFALASCCKLIRQEVMPIIHDTVLHDAKADDLALFPTSYGLFGHDTVRKLIVQCFPEKVNPRLIARIFPNARSVVPHYEIDFVHSDILSGDDITFRVLHRDKGMRDRVCSEIMKIVEELGFGAQHSVQETKVGKINLAISLIDQITEDGVDRPAGAQVDFESREITLDLGGKFYKSVLP